MTARLGVDLSALSGNIARVRERVAPAQLMLVVKDDAYGHGLDAVVRRAADSGVRWFGAFDAKTGSATRAALRGATAPGDEVRIFAWIAASDDELRAALDADLDLGVGDSELLEQLAQVANGAGAAARVHLKIDTGLHRNGVRPELWPAFVARAASLESEGAITVVGVWSHIAEASDDEDDAARETFEWAYTQVLRAGLRPQVRHLAASAASFARPEFRYDLVRVGAFCYGIRSAGGPAATELGLTPVGALQAEVVDVDGDEVEIDLGALDGLPSSLAGRVTVGTPAGRRLLRVVDARSSRVEAWADAAIGDVVTVYGRGEQGEGSATDLAESIGTIGEEIAVRVSPLIPRVYAGW